MKYIYHHLGLGDHIICNGLVRHYKEIHGEVTVFCKLHNHNNVQYMYRDDKKINILPIWDDDVVINYISENNIEKDTIVVGHGGMWRFPNVRFDEAFYNTVELPFEYRFTKFYLKRDLKKEKEILKEVNPNNEKYIFTHGINLDRVRKDLKIIENPSGYGLFDLLYLIEGAEEVHLMESSIKNLVNSIKIKKPKFFYHQYSRGYSDYHNTQGLNKFEIIY